MIPEMVVYKATCDEKVYFMNKNLTYLSVMRPCTAYAPEMVSKWSIKIKMTYIE